MNGVREAGTDLALLVGGVLVFMFLVGRLFFSGAGPSGRVREGYLTLVVGLRGGGKSVFVSRLIAERLRCSVPVLTNFSCAGAPKMRSWSDAILAPRGTMVVLDEAHVWAGARSGVTLRPVVGWYISMCRHLGHEVWLISQHEDQIASAVRNQVNLIVECRETFLPSLRPWSRNWVTSRHAARCYAPHDFRKRKARPLWTWKYSPRGRAVEIFDTHDLIPPVRDRKVSYEGDYDLIEDCIALIQDRQRDAGKGSLRLWLPDPDADAQLAGELAGS